MSKGAYRASTIGSALSLRAILNQEQISLPGELHDGLHVAGVSAQVNDKDRAALRSQNCPDRIHGDVLSVAVHVRKHWNRAPHGNAARRSTESTAAGDDLIPRSNANRTQCQFEGDGSIRHRNRVLRAASIGKFPLKGFSLLSGAVVHVAAAHYVS